MGNQHSQKKGKGPDELRINLNNKLQTNDHKLTPAKIAQDKTRIFMEQSYDNNLYSGQTNNGLLNAFLLAYNKHLPLRIKPDVLHCALQLTFATYINNNAEKFRHCFVDHDGQKKLEVTSDELNVHVFADLMSREVKNNVKNPELLECLEMVYTTSTPLSQTVSKSLIFNTLKSYFT